MLVAHKYFIRIITWILHILYLLHLKMQLVVLSLQIQNEFSLPVEEQATASVAP